jgi:hypothetical protein
MNRRVLALLVGLATGWLAWAIAPHAGLAGWWALRWA